jgi:hypothetical protein
MDAKDKELIMLLLTASGGIDRIAIGGSYASTPDPIATIITTLSTAAWTVASTGVATLNSVPKVWELSGLNAGTIAEMVLVYSSGNLPAGDADFGDYVEFVSISPTKSCVDGDIAQVTGATLTITD